MSRQRIGTATVTARAFEISCPRCGAAAPAEGSGSLMWDAADLLACGRDILGCGCGERFRVRLGARPEYPLDVQVLR